VAKFTAFTAAQMYFVFIG